MISISRFLKRVNCVSNNYKIIFQESSLEYLNPTEQSAANCRGFQVLPPNSFFPIKWYEASRLWIDFKTAEDWDEEFRDSYTIHFYQSSWRTGTKTIKLFRRNWT